MITVFGATGNTGGAAAAALLKAGKKVRAVGRSADKLSKLVAAGAESAVGSIEDPAFVKQALSGAKAAYVLIPPNLTVDDFHAYARRVIEAVTSGLDAAKVGHVVLLSSIGAHHSAGTGPIVMVREFENRLKQLPGTSALFLRPGFFMENVFMGMHLLKTQGIYGGPMPAEATVQMIAAADIGDYAGKRLAALDFSGKSVVHLFGPEAISGTHIASSLGRAVGKPVKYAHLSLEDIEKGMHHGGLSPSMVKVFMEMYRGAGQGLLAPEPGSPQVLTPTSFESFAKNVFAPAFA